MSFVYPVKLYSLIQSNWEMSAWEDKTLPPLPSEEVVQNLIDVVYHASFLTEESRKLWFRVIYIDPRELHDRHLRGISPIAFKESRSFTVTELLKLSPSVNPLQVLIGVYETRPGSGELRIWGLIASGNTFGDFIKHGSSFRITPPNGLIISSKSPGQISISRQGDVILILKQGKLYNPFGDVFMSGPVVRFFDSAIESLYLEIDRKINGEHFLPVDMNDEYTRRFYLYFLQRVLNRIREKFHGGALIVIPDHMGDDDKKLAEYLTIKYPCVYTMAWDYLVQELVRYKKHKSLDTALRQKPALTDREYDEVSNLSRWAEYNDEYIASAVSFLSELSGADGAILMTDRLRLLGFGAEIIVPKNIARVHCITSVSKNTGEYIDIELFGTRHRSALRLCAALPHCVAFIVSQDGDIRIARNVNDEVIMWSDVNVAGIGF